MSRKSGNRFSEKACGYVGAMCGSAGISRTPAEVTSRMGDSRCKTDGKQNPTGFHDLQPVARAERLSVHGAFWLLSLAPRPGSPQLSAPVPLAEGIALDAIAGMVQTATRGSRQPPWAADHMPRQHDFGCASAESANGNPLQILRTRPDRSRRPLRPTQNHDAVRWPNAKGYLPITLQRGHLLSRAGGQIGSIGRSRHAPKRATRRGRLAP